LECSSNNLFFKVIRFCEYFPLSLNYFLLSISFELWDFAEFMKLYWIALANHIEPNIIEIALFDPFFGWIANRYLVLSLREINHIEHFIFDADLYFNCIFHASQFLKRFIKVICPNILATNKFGDSFRRVIVSEEDNLLEFTPTWS